MRDALRYALRENNRMRDQTLIGPALPQRRQLYRAGNLVACGITIGHFRHFHRCHTRETRFSYLSHYRNGRVFDYGFRLVLRGAVTQADNDLCGIKGLRKCPPMSKDGLTFREISGTTLDTGGHDG